MLLQSIQILKFYFPFNFLGFTGFPHLHKSTFCYGLVFGSGIGIHSFSKFYDAFESKDVNLFEFVLFEFELYET